MSHHTTLELPSKPLEDYKSTIKQPTDQVNENKSLTNLPDSVPIMLGGNQVSMYLMAGAAAGIMEHCVMYPIDSVKTRMQSLRPDPRAVYTSIHHALKKIMQTEGIFRPFHGVNIVALGAGPAHALYFSSYELTKKLFGNDVNGANLPIANAAAGAVATCFHDGTMNPVEVIKQRLQIYGSPYRGAFHCAQTILKNEGVGAFYRSFTTQLTMNIPFQCVHFVTYEYFRELLNPPGGYDPKTHLLSGAIAGGVAAAITTPLDVAKTLLNTQEQRAVSEIISNSKALHSKGFVGGMFSALKTVYKLQGIYGYFRGTQARIVYHMPSCAISWSVYEFFKNSLSLKISDEEIMDLTA
ncbi:mitoferrin-1 [Hydra vulgaris]|uniref:Mitoferrin-1 n=1 Tax=Hydra vulgaris TaxID=6087 RepID=T2M3R2_HYDVU|nr:mitoferrin-1 [Hydra vulgaris]